MLYNLETSNESEAVIPEIGLSASPRTARNVDETAGATSIPTTRAAPPRPGTYVKHHLTTHINQQLKSNPIPTPSIQPSEKRPANLKNKKPPTDKY